MGAGREGGIFRAGWGDPALLLAGSMSAVASTIALAVALGWVLVLTQLADVGAWPAILTALLVYDATLVATKPAILPGLYALAEAKPDSHGFPDVGRTIVHEARSDYRRVASALLRARVASLGFSLLLAPLVVAGGLVVATTASFVLYGLDVVQTPDPLHFMVLLLGGLLAVRAAGVIPIAYAERLVLDGESPQRAWRASVALVRDDLRSAGSIATVRVALGSMPFVAAFGALLVLSSESPSALVVPVAVVLLVGTITKPVEATTTVRGYARLASPPSTRRTPGRVIDRSLPRPSFRTVLVVLLVLGLGVASAGVRVADVRPNPGPSAEAPLADPATAEPADLYAVARNRTQATSRNVSVTTVGQNVTTGERVLGYRIHANVDFAAREVGGSAWIGENGSWVHSGYTYASDGLYVPWGWGDRPHHALWETTVGEWRVFAAPKYAELVRTSRIAPLPAGHVDWRRPTVTDDALVLTIDDPETVRAAVGQYDPTNVRYRNESQIRVRIDRDTQRLERIDITERIDHYEHDARRVRDRSHSETTVRYRYEGVHVRRPADVGFQPPALLWDVLYY